MDDELWSQMAMDERLAYLRAVFLNATLLDPRLRALLELAGWGSSSDDDTVINKWTTTFKPNPEDPNGPHGPSARLNNPSVGSNTFRPRSGRLL
jgi:hypothetical protein